MTARSPEAPAYTLFKMDISYFSGKLEGYLRCKGLGYAAIEVDDATFQTVFDATGVRKVPALRLADGRWLFDTTPTIAWLEQAHPAPAFVPQDPALAFVALLVEDYADEWLWRPAMWWRWEPVATRHALGRRVAENLDFPLLPRAVVARLFPLRQRRLWLWGDGMHRGNADAIRNLYLDELDFLESVLAQQPFLLGSRPSMADFGYFGPMFRHFGNDPDPAEIMRRRAPAVYQWLARIWRGRRPAFDTPPQWHWPTHGADGPDWSPLLRRLLGDYLPYLRANAEAYRDGRRRFDWQGQSLSLRGSRTHRYRVWCHQQLQRCYRALADADQARVNALFAPIGDLRAAMAVEAIDAGLDAQLTLPRESGGHTPTWRTRWFGEPR